MMKISSVKLFCAVVAIAEAGQGAGTTNPTIQTAGRDNHPQTTRREFISETVEEPSNPDDWRMYTERDRSLLKRKNQKFTIARRNAVAPLKRTRGQPKLKLAEGLEEKIRCAVGSIESDSEVQTVKYKSTLIWLCSLNVRCLELLLSVFF